MLGAVVMVAKVDDAVLATDVVEDGVLELVQEPIPLRIRHPTSDEVDAVLDAVGAVAGGEAVAVTPLAVFDAEAGRVQAPPSFRLVSPEQVWL